MDEQEQQDQHAPLRGEAAELWDRLDALWRNGPGMKERTLQAAYWLFTRNFKDLRLRLAETEEPNIATPQFDWSDPNLVHQYLFDVSRLLHNYIAGASTYEAIISRSYAKGALNLELSNGLRERLTEKPVFRFVRALRRYFLHYDFPITESTVSVSPAEGFKHDILLNVSALRESRDFDSAKVVRDYAASLPGKVRLIDLIEQHVRVVLEFHVWLISKHPDWHRDQIAEMAVLQKRLSEILSEINWPNVQKES